MSFDVGDRVRVWCRSSKFHNNEGRIAVRKVVNDKVFWGVSFEFSPSTVNYFGTGQLERVS